VNSDRHASPIPLKIHRIAGPMLSLKLYKRSGVYDFFIKSLGYERSIDRFLQSVSVQQKESLRILDAGCGTGMLGLHFLQRFPQYELVATDLEPNFLRATLANARNRGIEPRRIQVGVANISAPHLITSLDQTLTTLDDESFGVICVGAVVGYASDKEQCLRHLIRLLAPGGLLINMEMNESPTGRFVSRRYHYSNIPLFRMQQLLRDEGCEVTTTRLGLTHLPAKLTRTAIIARKRASSDPGSSLDGLPASHPAQCAASI
jgi:ubiquinone/menaquinone biosynthesis C-methylase UbiE